MRNSLANRWMIAAFMAVLLLPVGMQAQSASDLTKKLDQLKAYPEVVVVNGKVYTIDGSMRQAQALAVKNGRILAIGTNDEIRFLAGPQTEVIDAKGRAVLPGMLDSHTHPHLWAVEHWMGSEGDFAAKKYNDPQLQIHYAKGNDQATILRELERIVRERAQSMGPNKWIWVNLFGGKDLPANRKITYSMFPSPSPAGGGGTTGAPLTRQFLDTLAPNNPLMVMVGEAIGPGANNSKARDEMVKYVGMETVGLQSRNAVTYEILLRNRLNEAVDFVKRELLECIAAQGITTFGNHYYNSPSIMKVYMTMKERNEMPVRWAWFFGGHNQKVGGNGDPDIDSYFATLGDFEGVGDDFIWNAGIANEGWEWGPQGQGGIGTCTGAKPLPTALKGELYMPCEDNLADVEKYGGYKFVRAALRKGFRIGYLHFYSDGTFDALFKMLDEEVAAGRITVDQIRALRISTEHNPMIRPDSMANIAKYNIMPGFNGYQVQGNIKGGAFLKNYGEQYMSWMAPMKSVLNAGAKPVFNTDLHLNKVKPESKDMDYPEQWDGNIFALLEFFVTRKMPHDGITYARNEAMDRASLMKAATIWGAEQVMNEKNIGSLEVGKLADFFITDKDYFTVPEDQIHTIKVMLTATGGKTVYKATNY